MTTEQKFVVAEQIGEALLGGAIGITVTNVVFPKCDNAFEKAVVLLGTSIGSWMIGRTFCKHLAKFCDDAFDTELSDDLNL